MSSGGQFRWRGAWIESRANESGLPKEPAKPLYKRIDSGAAGGNRTHDLSLTKDALYH